MRIFGIPVSRYLGISILLLFSLSVMAQSNLTYELKVGMTAENTLLAEFPESYSGEKINIMYNVQCTMNKRQTLSISSSRP